ncbi:MAG: Peptidase S8 and S53, subtilisin, kexin, sedolisin [Berkelbacteria bacterium GW2011_GWA2_35_9]|uniref:Peptidase S8 and S53, subtilisin, kexin, sedolisin n=1 Tax=Berkelbacteria bacterium GW2011_GWA2_35_9 TaxID=1618333 RepID=A0A0G0D4J7_9BACT|nr:MAG: Peptidase S8 and S53, subtilisin, kexin, sedolisin [Berkelbacteria bacterium GW2011_GWA2_35_9]
MIGKKLHLVLSVFWFIIAVIFIGASFLIVVDASGYIVNWRELTFEKTGLISISTNPKDAKIYLSGKLYKKLTPSRLTKLPPNWYDIKISYTDYQDWEEGFKLDAGQAINLEDIYLFYKNPIVEKKVIEKEKFDKYEQPKNLLIEKNELYLISNDENIILTRFTKNINRVDWLIKNKYLIAHIDDKIVVFSKDESDQKEIYSSKNEFNFIVLNESEIAVKSGEEIIVLKIR